jgi:hypothetical protein
LTSFINIIVNTYATGCPLSKFTPFLILSNLSHRFSISFVFIVFTLKFHDRACGFVAHNVGISLSIGVTCGSGGGGRELANTPPLNIFLRKSGFYFWLLI